MEWAECHEHTALIKWGSELPSSRPLPVEAAPTTIQGRSRGPDSRSSAAVCAFTRPVVTPGGAPECLARGPPRSRPAAAPLGARRPAQIHNLLNTGIDWGAAGALMGKGLDVPLAERLSLFSSYLIFTLSHTHTRKHAHIVMRVLAAENARRREEKRRTSDW